MFLVLAERCFVLFECTGLQYVYKPFLRLRPFPFCIGQTRVRTVPQNKTLPMIEHGTEYCGMAQSIMLRISDFLSSVLTTPNLVRSFGLFCPRFWRFRLTNVLNSDVSGDSSTAEGKKLAGMLLSMLDERDRRLVVLAFHI